MNAAAFGPVEALSDTHDVEAFDSGVAELDGWLRRSARVAAGAGTAATYVVCRGRRVVGFYALAMSAVGHSRAPSRLRRGMPDPVPVVLLARLAVDALSRCVRGGREFGARAVVVDAITPDAADFYRHFGFHDLDDGRLWRRLTDIERALCSGARDR